MPFARYIVIALISPLIMGGTVWTLSVRDLIQSTPISGHRYSSRGEDKITAADDSKLIEYLGGHPVNISVPSGTDVSPGWYVLLRCATGGGAQCVISVPEPKTANVYDRVVLASGEAALLYSDGFKFTALTARANPGRATAVASGLAPTKNIPPSDGDFSSCGAWTCGTGWSISGNVARHIAGASAGLSRPIAVTRGTPYQVSLTDSGRTAGFVRLSIGAASALLTPTADGVQSAILTPIESGAQLLMILPTSTYNGAITNLSIKPVAPEPGTSIISTVPNAYDTDRATWAPSARQPSTETAATSNVANSTMNEPIDDEYHSRCPFVAGHERSYYLGCGCVNGFSL